MRILLEQQRNHRHAVEQQQRLELAKIDAKIAKTVRELFDSGASVTVIAETYGTLDRHTIYKILKEEV